MLSTLERARLARDLTAKLQALQAMAPGGGLAQVMAKTRIFTEINALSVQLAPQAAPAALTLAKYADGRTIPVLGDKVYTYARGMFGSKAGLNGDVARGTNGLFVRITGSGGMMGERTSSKTTPLTEDWTLMGEEHGANRVARLQTERLEREAKAIADEREAALSIGAARNGTLDVSLVKLGDVLELPDGRLVVVGEMSGDGGLFGYPLDEPDEAPRGMGTDMRGIKPRPDVMVPVDGMHLIREGDVTKAKFADGYQAVEFDFETNEYKRLVAPAVVAPVKLTDTPAFKAWFGASKVRDDEGEPLRLYHATAKDFSVFKAGGVDPSLSGHAIWLTPSKENQPAHHNTSNRSGYREGVNVMPLYAKIERPLVIDDQNSLDWARSAFAGGSMEFPQVMPQGWADEVMKGGEYDGIIFDGRAIFGGAEADIEYIVFKPSQIKSAIGNNGAFDPGSDNITDSVASPLERMKMAARLSAKVAEMVALSKPGGESGAMGMMLRARLAKEVNELLVLMGGAGIANEHVQMLTDIAEGRKDGSALDVLWSLIYQAVEALEDSEALMGSTENLAHAAITRWAELEEKTNG